MRTAISTENDQTGTVVTPSPRVDRAVLWRGQVRAEV
jgi:hypothetical protein